MGRPLIAFFACAAAAAAADLSETLKAIERRYNTARTLQVQFTESFSAPSRPRRTESGTLYLRKPGRMRWEYSAPKGKLFISDGAQAWLYTPHNNRVERIKLRESEDMRAPLAFLLGRLDFQKEFRRFVSRPDPLGTRIVAEPRSEKMPYKQVEFVAAPDAQLRQVIVTGHDGSVLAFDFEGEKRNVPVADSLFQYRVPPGAELVEESD